MKSFYHYDIKSLIPAVLKTRNKRSKMIASFHVFPSYEGNESMSLLSLLLEISNACFSSQENIKLLIFQANRAKLIIGFQNLMNANYASFY